MRVLQVARQFYPKVGGIESCVLNLSRRLLSRGHQVEVVTLDRDLITGAPIDSPSVIDSIPIHRVPYLGSRRYPIAPSWLRFTSGFDVIHIHAIDFFIDSAAAAKSIRFLSAPVVLTTHGGIFHTAAWRNLKKAYWHLVLRQTLTAAEKVVAVSDTDAALFSSIVEPEKLVTIPNGIDSVFSQPGSARVRGRLMCVGRVSPSKALDKVVQLVASIADERPDLELVIVGPDENDTAAALKRQAVALGIEGQVRVLGPLAASDLAALVSSAHLFISAAPHEGFGITTVEALSAGVPVFVTRTGVHEQVVEPGANGWLWSGVPDADAVATLRAALLLPEPRLDEMQRAARNSAAPFSWELTTDRYEQVYKNAHRQSVG